MLLGQLLLANHDLRHVRVHWVDFFHRPPVEGLGTDDVEKIEDFHKPVTLVNMGLV